MTLDLRYIIIPAVCLVAFFVPTPIIWLLFKFWGYYSITGGTTLSLIFGAIMVFFVALFLGEQLRKQIPLTIWKKEE